MANGEVGDVVAFRYEGRPYTGVVIKVTRKGVNVRQTSPRDGAGETFWMHHHEYGVVKPQGEPTFSRSVAGHIYEKYLEYHDDRKNSHKFYHVWVEQKGKGATLSYEVFRSWGRIGSAGQTMSEVLTKKDYGIHVTPAAKDMAEKLVQSKLKKGYSDFTSHYFRKRVPPTGKVRCRGA
jgi:predicted DNA-binding WGR domain protein